MSAAAERPRVATYVIHESHELPTDDHEDHTFCGMMFDVEAKVPKQPNIPVEYLEISAIAVRGDLGFLEVYATPETYMFKQEEPSAWVKCYEGFQAPSRREYRTLPLQETIVLKPGERCGLYVHSRNPGDDAIVYDDQRAGSREDLYIRVMPGQAHLSNKPFGRRGPWGTAWRHHREFVGRVSYGVKWLLWNPEVHDQFPPEFQQLAFLMLWAIQQPNASIACLPQEVIMYTLNMCRWDWIPLKVAPPVFAREATRPRQRLPFGLRWGYVGYGNDDEATMGEGTGSDASEHEEEEDGDEGSTGGEDPMEGSGLYPQLGSHPSDAMVVVTDSDEEGAEEELGESRPVSRGSPADAGEPLNDWEDAVRRQVRERWGGEACC